MLTVKHTVRDEAARVEVERLVANGYLLQRLAELVGLDGLPSNGSERGAQATAICVCGALTKQKKNHVVGHHRNYTAECKYGALIKKTKRFAVLLGSNQQTKSLA